MNALNTVGLIFVVVLVILSILCLLGGCPWVSISASLSAGFIFSTLEDEDDEDCE